MYSYIKRNSISNHTFVNNEIKEYNGVTDSFENFFN